MIAVQLYLSWDGTASDRRLCNNRWTSLQNEAPESAGPAMKSLIRNTLPAIAAAIAGCASVPSTSADICGQIAGFANSSSNRSVHRVELTGDRKCESGGYQPGVQLCQYLTSTGSPDMHIRKALECLRDTDIDRYDGNDAPYPVTIRYTSRMAEYTDRLVLVRIEYPADTKVPASLTISAQKVTAFRQPRPD
jgi:hypothetical protein